MSTNDHLEALDNTELRKKLLHYGFDLPTSVGKVFLLKQLRKAIGEQGELSEPYDDDDNSSNASSKRKSIRGRKSVGVMSPSHSPAVKFPPRQSLAALPAHSPMKSGSSVIPPSSPLTPAQQDVIRRRSLAPMSPTSAPSPPPSNQNNQKESEEEEEEESEEEEDEEEEEEEEEEEDEELENSPPSPRYQKYLSYFKGDTSKMGDPFATPRSQYSSPAGSPYSTAANFGSPSYRNLDFDDSGDDSDADFQSHQRPPNRIRSVLTKVNPVNWIPNPKNWFVSKKVDVGSKGSLNFNFGSSGNHPNNGYGLPSSPTNTPSALGERLALNNNGHLSSNNIRQRASLASSLYSPAINQPQPALAVPPAMVAGRQAGFKAFFSRGERNGYGHPSANNITRAVDNSHLVPKLLLLGFIVGGIGVLGTYYYKAMYHMSSPLAHFGRMTLGLVLSMIKYIAGFGLLTVFGIGLYKMLMHIRSRKEREEKEMFDLVEKVIALLEQHYERNEQVLAINHIRDEIFNVRERKQKEALWNNVVNYISNCESRVREEIQSIAGEEFRVWRWLPSTSPLSKRMSSGPSTPSRLGETSQGTPGRLYPNLSGMEVDSENQSGSTSPNSQWQGQAFEIFAGGPNFLPQPPTTCLKIRQMFDTNKDGDGHRIEQAILEKCVNAKILHIGIDRSTREGCVYIRCQSKIDAKNAYSALHGWWFDSHLLSVKFLREDRYFQRFPDAQQRTVAMTNTTYKSSSFNV